MSRVSTAVPPAWIADGTLHAQGVTV